MQGESLDAENLPEVMRRTAAHFVAALQAMRGSQPLQPPALPPYTADLTWDNAVYAGPVLRRGHVETFEVPGHFAVLHVCLIPCVTLAMPIFGFDMIAGNGQASGIFLDFSPTEPSRATPSLSDILLPEDLGSFRHRRSPPEWGDIFSDDFLAIRPANRQEIYRALDYAKTALRHYLQLLETAPCAESADIILSWQTAYAMGQRRNPHTARMLSRYVGETAARQVMDDVLFPLPQRLCT